MITLYTIWISVWQPQTWGTSCTVRRRTCCSCSRNTPSHSRACTRDQVPAATLHRYELTLKSSEQTGNGSSRSREIKKRCKELEQKNVMIMMLKNAIKEQEKKYLEKLKAKSCKVKMLFSELE